ncbi:MAG: YggS family pyridoxal phosphate-dependent enzyme [Anaerovoracaceae bacterium]|jgi:pyridoxal phosphate enzyme (YggS family)
MGTIQENIKKINTMKEEIAKRVGEKPEDILLVAVTKTRSAEEINEAIEGGITDIGENKVQEILDKYDRVNTVRWHMIGHLQTNKVKYIVDKVSLIHSVDSFKLAEEIDKRAGRLNKMMDILIQVNAAEEDSKFGTTIEETGLLIKTILDNCNNICIKGLMSIAPYADNPEDIRIFFKQVKKLYDEYSTLNHKNLNFKYLSMGMSHDYVTAIEEGSNLIRVGTAIFGPRNYSL